MHYSLLYLTTLWPNVWFDAMVIVGKNRTEKWLKLPFSILSMNINNVHFQISTKQPNVAPELQVETPCSGLSGTCFGWRLFSSAQRTGTTFVVPERVPQLLWDQTPQTPGKSIVQDISWEALTIGFRRSSATLVWVVEQWTRSLPFAKGVMMRVCQSSLHVFCGSEYNHVSIRFL